MYQENYENKKKPHSLDIQLVRTTDNFTGMKFGSFLPYVDFHTIYILQYTLAFHLGKKQGAHKSSTLLFAYYNAHGSIQCFSFQGKLVWKS